MFAFIVIETIPKLSFNFFNIKRLTTLYIKKAIVPFASYNVMDRSDF